MFRFKAPHSSAVALILLAALASSASAATRQVCASGCSYVSIQDAVDAAGTGDTVMVLDPIHTEGGIVIATDLTLAGDPANRPIVQAGAAPGVAVERVLEILPNADVVVRDLVIRHGRPSADTGGGGILNGGDLRLVRTDVVSNDANGWHGGGVRSTGPVELVDSLVSGNVADILGGGISCEGLCSLAMRRSTVDGNLVHTATSGTTGGGGLYISGTGRLESSQISHNVCAGGGFGGSGGGINEVGGELVLIDTDVVANQAGRGGGIMSGGPLTVVRGSISDNTATDTVNAAGGIASSGDPTLLESTVIAGNAGTAGGVAAWSQGFTIRRTTIVDNHASGAGGGVRMGATGLTIVEDSLVAGNTALAGGGVAVYSFTEVRVRNSTISGNTSDEDGGGLWVGTLGTLELSNVTVTDNTASPGGLTGVDGGGIFVSVNGGNHGDVVVRSSIIAGNRDFSPVIFAQAPDCAGPITVDGWLSLGGLGLTGLDPACLVSGATPDIGGDQGLLPLADNGGPTMTHALTIGSPNVDTGDPTGCRDAHGALIPADQRGGARLATCDRGAFEYGATVPLLADGFESGELWLWSAVVD